MIKKNLGELLLEYGMIEEHDIEEALKIQKEKGIRIGEALIEMGKVTEYDIEYILSVQLGIPYVLIDDLKIDNKLLSKFPSDFLIENRILPIYETDSEISIATDDPFNEEAFNRIKNFFNKQVKLSCADGSKILDFFDRTFINLVDAPLINEIEKIIEDMKDKNYFRIDFYLNENGVSIGIYGNKKLKLKKVIRKPIDIEAIFKSFEDLKIPFYYDLLESNDQRFLTIFPALNEEENIKFPYKVNKYGLVKINTIHFSDLKSNMIDKAFYSESVIPGYPYFSFKKEIVYEKSISILDQGDSDA